MATITVRLDEAADVYAGKNFNVERRQARELVRLGAEIALETSTELVRKLRSDLELARRKANAPQ